MGACPAARPSGFLLCLGHVEPAVGAGAGQVWQRVPALRRALSSQPGAAQCRAPSQL